MRKPIERYRWLQKLTERIGEAIGLEKHGSSAPEFFGCIKKDFDLGYVEKSPRIRIDSTLANHY